MNFLTSITLACFLSLYSSLMMGCGSGESTTVVPANKDVSADDIYNANAEAFKEAMRNTDQN